MFGFQKTEDQKNQGGTLLSIKLLNLAVVLSLTNLQLNILRHQILPSCSERGKRSSEGLCEGRNP